ncbi:MAG: UDP-glucose 4-epimerase GalE [Rhodospirillales bacterium]|nr:UDP-glucose 4-epimerase GalE [Rhodospirillales bacterium]
MSRTYLVTGGAGYIGSHVVVDLLDRGHRVIVFDNLQQGHQEAVHADATLIEGDLADADALRALFAQYRFDGILHFAANSLVGESMKKPFRYVGDNVVNAINLIRAAVDNDVRRFVLSSTCAIFGLPSRVPIDEDVEKNPANSYGESKLMIERILRWADEIHGLHSASLRYFNAAGSHPDVPIGEDHAPETHLIPITFEAVLGQRPYVEIFGDDYATPDGTCVRDYIHVCDLSDAHIRVLDAVDAGSCQYNVGIGHGYSVREVIESVRRVTGHPLPQKIGPRRAGDPPTLVAAPDRIRRELGWEPRFVDLDEIVRTAWSWRKAHPNGFAAGAAAKAVG